MTGNKNAWRAPLAGLASVAMIATMGVAASTANAAAAEFTFNLANTNVYKFDKTKTSDQDVEYVSDTKVTIKDQDNDGKLGVAEAQKVDATLTATRTDVSDFTKTGWYDGTNPVAASGKFDKSSTATSVTAHVYANDDIYTVTVDGNAQPGGHNVKFGGQDKVAAWQLPEDTDKTNHQLLKGYAPAKQSYDGVIDFATVDLASFATNNTKNVELKSVNVESNYVQFVTPTSTGNDDAWKITPADAENGQVYTVEVAQNEKFSAYGEIPQAFDGSVATSNFKADPTDSDEAVFSADTTIVKDMTLEAVVKGASSYVTVSFDVSDASNAANVSIKDQKVAVGGTATAPTAKLVKDDNDNVKYGSYDWYEVKDNTVADKPFNFTSKVNAAVTLKAVFKATEIRVGFDPAYGTESVQYVWFKDGDTFTSPTITKDGKIATFTGAPADGKVLSISGEKLTYLLNADEQVNENEIAAGTVFKATYDSANQDTLTALEQKAASNEEGWFTAASYKQYLEDFEQYLADKKAKGPDYTVSEYAELIKELKGIQSELVEKGDTRLYRVYNPNNGDHYYTVDQNEAANLVTLGWKSEGSDLRAVAARSVSATVPANLGEAVYSMYNPYTGEHLLVTDKAEIDSMVKAGWDNQGVKFYTAQNGSKAVKRLYNKYTAGPAHHYTADQNEIDHAVKAGWQLDFNGATALQLD